MERQRHAVVQFLQTEENGAAATNPDDSQKEKKRDSAGVSIDARFSQAIFQPGECVTHQPNRMSRINGVANHKIQRYRSSEYQSVGTKEAQLHFADQPSATPEEIARAGCSGST